MTELTLRISDESLVPMLRKLINSIDGVEIERHRKRNGIEMSLDDKKNGRVYRAKDGKDLIKQCLND